MIYYVFGHFWKKSETNVDKMCATTGETMWKHGEQMWKHGTNVEQVEKNVEQVEKRWNNCRKNVDPNQKHVVSVKIYS